MKMKKIALLFCLGFIFSCSGGKYDGVKSIDIEGNIYTFEHSAGDCYFIKKEPSNSVNIYKLRETFLKEKRVSK